MRFVPSNALCKISFPQYPEMVPFMLTLALPLSLFPVWHAAPSQLPLWCVHARSKGTGKSLQVQPDLKTLSPIGLTHGYHDISRVVLISFFLAAEAAQVCSIESSCLKLFRHIPGPQVRLPLMSSDCPFSTGCHSLNTT